MKFFNDLRIGNKILTGFIIVCVLTGILGLYSFFTMGKIEQGGKDMYTNCAIPLEQISAVQSNILEIKSEFLAAIYEKDVTKIKNHETEINNYLSKNAELMAAYEKTKKDTKESAAYDKYSKDFSAFQNISSETINLLKSAQYNKTDESLAFITTSIITLNSDLQNLISIQTNEANSLNNSNNATYNASIIFTLTIIVIALFISLLLGLLLSSTIRKRLNMLKEVTDKIVMGDIDIEIKNKSKDEIGELADSYKSLIIKTKGEANIVKQISEGNFNIEIEPKSDKDVLGHSLLSLLDTVKTVSIEINNLVQAVSDGKLDTRSDSKRFSGDWKDVVNGLNELMDTFIHYISIMGEHFDGISKGVIMDKITNEVKGDWDKIKKNINAVPEALLGMIKDVNRLSKAGAEGDLKVRVDASKHKGAYNEIIEGINTMLETIINPLNEYQEVLVEMAKGNLHVSVNGNYKGEMASMKDALNHYVNAVYGHIAETSNVLKDMANGNLNVEVTGDYHGDFVELKESTNTIIRSFNETLGEINTAAEQVSAGTKQVSDSSQTLSQGSTEQAASIEEITSSITEIASQTKENAANANKANEMAESVKKNASEGNREMQGVLKAMEEINVSSTNISKIIKVIDDIAFQTNILALNAAVEAARAGQHGKGFAVVAEEVRNLAAKSADAAKETTGMIEESIKKAEDGKKITELTADALNKVTENIVSVAYIINGIAVASNDQASAIGQINQAIEEVSKVTQSNTATAEETASASEELSSQAILVKERVGRFVLKKRNMSQASYNELDEKTLNMIQDMLTNRDEVDKKSRTSYTEASTAYSPKFKISLDDKEFGKY